MLLYQQFNAVHCSQIHRRFISSTTRIIFKENLPAQAYRPEYVENNKYEKWAKDGLFTAENPSDKPTFSIILPPPNVTGKLHLGHALASTIEDVIVRRKRSMGYNVLWLPGTDHAGIATQGVVEKYLKNKYNINRQDMGREKFNKEVWKWKDKHGNTICEQLRTLGCSLDWTRQLFTMDPKHTHAVNTAFITLFNKGLIYRRKALVNWCTKLKSTVSDIEVDSLTLKGPTDMVLPGYDKPVKFGLLVNFAYRIDDSNDEIVVSTTMPETMLGDTAIAVHPDDKRYQHLSGKRAVHPFLNKTIPIICDDFVDMKFGTGAVKITPAHSKIDYEIGKDHHLPMIQVISEEGVMMNANEFNNMKRYDCRQAIVQRLGELDLLRQVTPHEMTLPICSRTGDVIQHMPKEQWFLSCSELNERAKQVVQNGQLNIEPEKFVKNWFQWTEDDRDWCISRQLWWGHQIPAYKCNLEKNIIWIAATDEISAKTAASKYLRALPDEITAERDCDVLDTWFSSGIYPFASLGWPNHYAEDYRKFYPLNLMATGHDILGFWVHRMVILGLELTGTLPFKNVLLHGIICDNKGAKMSKSRGNVIDPIDVIYGISMDKLKEKTEEMHRTGILSKEELKKASTYHKSNFSSKNGIPECGVDALRFTLLSQDIKSHYVNFDLDMCHANKLFCNKIWQSIKYMQLNFVKLNLIQEAISRKDLTYFDKWILSRLADMVDKVNRSMDSYDFHLATKAIRSHIYNEFCDVYLETTKPGFDNLNLNIGYAHAHTLSAVLNTSLRCLAPFMVYVTEEIIPKVPEFETNIIYNFDDLNKRYLEFPQAESFNEWRNPDLEKGVEKILNTINIVRQLKSFYNITNKVRPAISIDTTDANLISDIVEIREALLNLTRCSDLKFNNTKDKQLVSGFLDKDTKIAIEMDGQDIDNAVQAAKIKIINKMKKIEETLSKLEEKLSSGPEWVRLSDQEKINTKKEELQQLQRLIDLGNDK